MSSYPRKRGVEAHDFSRVRLHDVKRKFNWDDKDIERLNMYHEQWNKLKNELKEKDLGDRK